MKKALSFLLMLILILSLAACGQAAFTDQDETSVLLLDGYPEDVLPLYQPDMLVSCGFSVRENDSYNIGKDIYTLTYESAADQQSLMDFYGGLLTERDAPFADEEDVVTDQLSGKIDDYKVELTFLDNAGSTTVVYVTLGLPDDMYTEKNAYFEDYPNDVVEMYGLLDVQEYTFDRQLYAQDALHYIIVYTTDITARDFSKYYEDTYSSKEDFEKSSSGTNAFSWRDGDFSIDIRYAGGDSPYITIDVSKAGR